ncbi:hypothetical protein MYAER_2849 [Microcystis aeruginosa NIES-2549]|uniref:Uncharacterized protein n=1 Tax=Microcystis aeruginosa NIES-2549 TaxID=1641812 RepID=A0A0F6U502_MICAE|nr:hypothetical protein MYAER_2849 [Microcystis aeruginosa NIES-2549]AOC53594.1 hypothetical protein amyaer_2887 [Microcystis aeruginosa NIES-2481]
MKHIEPLTRPTDACINFAVANSSPASGQIPATAILGIS